MRYFKDDDHEYLKWRDHHTNGFVLNLNSVAKNHSMIHKTTCLHLHDDDPKTKFTVVHVKECAETKEELFKWAKENSHQVKHCSTCKP